jgi:alpha-D-ribose 1-methylphosphonate 5-triphosphate synthase subunit PhnH
MIRVMAYDDVFHAQRHFRSILDCMSHPGRIERLDPVDFAPSAHLNKASALVAFALLNADVSCHLLNMADADAMYLSETTRARVAPIGDASFIFADGREVPDALEGANCGTLAYPDTAATIVIQVEAMSEQPLSGGLKLTLQGPGIEHTAHVYFRHINPDLLLALQARNAEFPLGIDALVTCDATCDDGSGGPRVLGIPRTARLSWESC